MINITPSIEKKIIDISRRTDKSLSVVQKIKTPHNYDLKLRVVNEFQYMGKSYKISSSDTMIFRVDDIPFSSNVIHTPVFKYDLKTAVTKRLVMPLILTKRIGTENFAIDWDNITIVKNYNFTYIIITDPDVRKDNVNAILIPNNIHYTTNVSSEEEYNKLSFAFDSRGAFASDYSTTVFGISIVSDNIAFYEYSFTDSNTGFVIELDKNKRVYLDNIILYKNNTLVLDNSYYITPVGPNTFKLSNIALYDTLYMRVFYNKNSNDSCDIYHKLPNNTLISCARLDVDNMAPAYYNIIKSEKLELSEDLPGSYEEIVKERFNRIVEYRKDLIYDTGVNTEYNYGNVRCFNIDTKFILDNIDSDNRVSLGLRFWKHTDGNLGGLYQTLIFVNNKLYSKYNSIIYNKNNTFSFDASDISEGDIVEIFYIGQVEDYKIPVTIPKDTKTVTLDNKYFDMRNSTLFLLDIPDSTDFININKTEHKMMAYKIPFSAIKIADDNSYIVTLEDENMYDKELLLVSNNQFKTYSDMSEDGENIAITLPNSFKYCHNKDQYMVFINGERVDKDKLEFVIPNFDNPYTNIAIYSSIILNKGDVVDVIYFPFENNETMTASVITEDGYINIDSTNLTFPINTENYWMFVNGRKVASKDIEIISDTLVRVVGDVKNINNVTLLLFSITPTQVEELFKTDKWNTIITSLSDSDIKDMFGNDIIINNDGENILDNETYKNTVLLEIYKDYYGLQYNGEPLLYTGDEELLSVCNTDKDNNYTLPVGNANNSDTFDFNIKDGD